VTSDKDNFGFSFVLADPWIRIGLPCVDEWRSSIDICPMGLDMEQITPDAARNLAYRAAKLIEMKGWQNQPMSFVLTLSLTRGDKMQGAMSLSQTTDSPHQVDPDRFRKQLLLSGWTLVDGFWHTPASWTPEPESQNQGS
jgi:hypothetical protein